MYDSGPVIWEGGMFDSEPVIWEGGMSAVPSSLNIHCHVNYSQRISNLEGMSYL